MLLSKVHKGEHVFSPRAAAVWLAHDASQDTALRASHLLVALTSADDSRALVSAALSRKSTQAISEKYQAKVEALWDSANKQSLAFLNLVLKNNPTTDIDKILKRPDIREAMRAPYVEAANKSEELLIKAWAESEVSSVKHAKGDFKMLKEAWKGYEVDLDLLDALVGDLHANAKAMRSRYSKALNEDRGKGLDKVASDVKQRASFSVSTAVWSVASSVVDSACALAGLNRVWVSRRDSATCTHCLDLHGKVVGPGEQFPISAKLKAYRGKLFGPPRHPRCRCKAVPTKLKKN